MLQDLKILHFTYTVHACVSYSTQKERRVFL